MKDQFINSVISLISDKFDYSEQQIIRNALVLALGKYTLQEAKEDLVPVNQDQQQRQFQLFVVAKKIEGCTDRTIRRYADEIRRFGSTVCKDWADITSDDIRLYIADMAIRRNCSKTTQDNTLRILRSFFGWLTAEEYIQKNPTLRLKKIRQERRIKKPFTEIECEQLRDGARDLRERAIIELLLSTGMRVGEIEGLNREDIEGDQCVVYGKGEKERYVYLNAKAIVSLDNYLQSRTDDNPALFVSLDEPHERLLKSGYEWMLRDLGHKLGIDDVHPHRFRRTAATVALNRGMPIEQVQKMLGHEQIATTLMYAQVSQENVKISHKKYLA